jgi:hypothetical protein
VIPSDVGVPALASLEGMAVNVRTDLSGHAPTNKVGVIEKAYVGEPLDNGAVPVYVEGYLFAKDFPDVVSDLQAAKDELGFSYECDASVVESDWNGKKALVASSVVFSGATILYKNKAAYTKTSFAAEGDNMNEEQLNAMLEAMGLNVNSLSSALAAWEAFKKEFEGDGKYASLSIYLNAAAEKDAKIDELSTKVAALEASLTEAQTKLNASTEVPEGFVKVEDYEVLKTKVDEMFAKVEPALTALKAEADAKDAFARKSVAAPRTLMAKYAVEEGDDLKALMASIDARTDIDSVAKIALKMEAQAKFNGATK